MRSIGICGKIEARADIIHNIICWDFDETLGNFRRLEALFLEEMLSGDNSIEPKLRDELAQLVGIMKCRPEPALKPGIGQLLGALSQYNHVLTTGSFGDYADYALRKMSIKRYFAEVFGREKVWRGYSKDYSAVMSHFGIAPAEAGKRMLIVGNDYEKDRPFSETGIVMIYDPNMANTPSEPIASVVSELDKAGGGDFRKGFEQLRQNQGIGTTVTCALEDGTRFSLQYFGNFPSKRLYPMVTEISRTTPLIGAAAASGNEKYSVRTD